MAITVLGMKRFRKHDCGQNGFQEIEMLCAFSTTDANGDIPVPFSTIISATICELGADQCYLNEATHVNTDQITVASGVVNVARGTQNVSAQKFFLNLRGY